MVARRERCGKATAGKEGKWWKGSAGEKVEEVSEVI